MKKNRLKLLLLFSAVNFGILNFNNHCQAQEEEGRGVTISPVSFELEVKPGERVNNTFKVFNPNKTKKDIEVVMEFEDFRPVGEEGKVAVKPHEKNSYSIKEWISINPEKFSLGANEQQFVNFSINVPENAEPGGKYGTIMATLGGSFSETGNAVGAAVAQKVGALVLLSVEGKVIESVSVKEIEVPEFSEYGPIPFQIRFINNGTVHARPRGVLVVYDWRKKKVASLELPQQNVIPEAVRKVETSWDQKWIFGRFRAEVVGIYGSQGTALKGSPVFFWVIPWKIAGGVALGGLILITILYRGRRRIFLILKVLIKGDKGAEVKKDE